MRANRFGVWLSTEAARGSHLDRLNKAPHLHQFSSLDIVLVSLAGLLIAVGLAGCGLFRHVETPQQQFTEALERGNSPQASYIWNNIVRRIERGSAVAKASSHWLIRVRSRRKSNIIRKNRREGMTIHGDGRDPGG